MKRAKYCQWLNPTSDDTEHIPSKIPKTTVRNYMQHEGRPQAVENAVNPPLAEDEDNMGIVVVPPQENDELLHEDEYLNYDVPPGSPPQESYESSFHPAYSRTLNASRELSSDESFKDADPDISSPSSQTEDSDHTSSNYQPLSTSSDEDSYLSRHVDGRRLGSRSVNHRARDSTSAAACGESRLDCPLPDQLDVSTVYQETVAPSGTINDEQSQSEEPLLHEVQLSQSLTSEELGRSDSFENQDARVLSEIETNSDTEENEQPYPSSEDNDDSHHSLLTSEDERLYSQSEENSEVEADHEMQEQQNEECGNLHEWEQIFSHLNERLEGPYSRIISEAPRITRAELLLNALTVANHFKLSFTAFEAVMKLTNSIFQQNILPSTRYTLDRLLMSFSGVHFHFCCSNCSECLGEADRSVTQSIVCHSCKNENVITDLSKCTFFLTYDICYQLELLFSDPTVLSTLKNPLNLWNPSSDIMRDVYDGSVYQNFVAFLRRSNNEEKHISVCFSVDGASVYKSSSCEIWPLFVMVLELPPRLRMSNLLLGGLWFGKSKPVMDVFLTPFVNYMEKLSTSGFTLRVGVDNCKMKAHVLCCCADAPARAAVQCIHQHNGSFGCNWCLHPGSGRKYCILDYVPEKRCKEEIVRDGHAALNMNVKDASVYGVTGISPCLLFSHMDIVNGMIVDPLHQTDHGVARQFTRAWLGEDGAEADGYIGTPYIREVMDGLISKIKLPIEARSPARKIADFGHWKARDFCNWILYVSVPLLMDVLPRQFFQHWAIFVQSIHILMQSEIPRSSINKAYDLLCTFVQQIELLYLRDGRNHMTYNVHLCLHLAEHVSRYGPLWSITSYSFEAGNGDLKKTIHANKGISSQVCRSLSHRTAFRLLQSRVSTPSSDKFRQEIFKNVVDRCIYIGKDKYLGKNKDFKPSDIENWLLVHRGLDSNQFTEVDKLIHEGCVYAVYKDSRATDNSIAITVNGFVKITRIIVSMALRTGFVFVNKIITRPGLVIPGVESDSIFLRKISFIEEEAYLLDPNELVCPCAKVTVGSGDFLIKVPNINNTC